MRSSWVLPLSVRLSLAFLSSPFCFAAVLADAGLIFSLPPAAGFSGPDVHLPELWQVHGRLPTDQRHRRPDPELALRQHRRQYGFRVHLTILMNVMSLYCRANNDPPTSLIISIDRVTWTGYVQDRTVSNVLSFNFTASEDAATAAGSSTGIGSSPPPRHSLKLRAVLLHFLTLLLRSPFSVLLQNCFSPSLRPSARFAGAVM